MSIVRDGGRKGDLEGIEIGRCVDDQDVLGGHARAGEQDSPVLQAIEVCRRRRHGDCIEPPRDSKPNQKLFSAGGRGRQQLLGLTPPPLSPLVITKDPKRRAALIPNKRWVINLQTL